MEINYFGVIRIMQAVLFFMCKVGKGLIINIFLLVGCMLLLFFGIYIVIKYVLEGYLQVLCYEVFFFGVDVVMVELGLFGIGLLVFG